MGRWRWRYWWRQLNYRLKHWFRAHFFFVINAKLIWKCEAMWRYLNRAYIRFIDLQTLNAHTFIFRYLFSIINGFFISSIYNTLHMYVVVIEFYLKLTVNQFILLFMLWRGKFFCHSTRALYDCFKWLGLVVVVLNFLEHSILHGTRKETVHWPMFILFFSCDWLNAFMEPILYSQLWVMILIRWLFTNRCSCNHAM